MLVTHGFAPTGDATTVLVLMACWLVRCGCDRARPAGRQWRSPGPRRLSGRSAASVIDVSTQRLPVPLVMKMIGSLSGDGSQETEFRTMPRLADRGGRWKTGSRSIWPTVSFRLPQLPRSGGWAFDGYVIDTTPTISRTGTTVGSGRSVAGHAVDRRPAPRAAPRRPVGSWHGRRRVLISSGSGRPGSAAGWPTVPRRPWRWWSGVR